jgi:hypothetical protein
VAEARECQKLSLPSSATAKEQPGMPRHVLLMHFKPKEYANEAEQKKA